jgi:hypothetical protein
MKKLYTGPKIYPRTDRAMIGPPSQTLTLNVGVRVMCITYLLITAKTRKCDGRTDGRIDILSELTFCCFFQNQIKRNANMNWYL